MHGYVRLGSSGVTYRWQIVTVNGGAALRVGTPLDFSYERVSERLWRLVRVERGVELEAYVALTERGLIVVEDIARVAPASERRRRAS